MEQTWIVLLEATGGTSGRPMSPNDLGAIIDAMACDQIIGIHDPYRYGVQVQIISSSPVGALMRAIARWEGAVECLGLEAWELQRAELVTPEEFDRECAAGYTDEGWDVRPGPGGEGEGDDLLRSVFCDIATGLPSAALFQDRAERAIAAAAGTGQSLALVRVDVDRFGAINREMGSTGGDQVLKALATRLAHLAHSPASVARLAANELALLVDDTAGSAERLAREILGAARTPLDVKGRTLALTASVAVVPVGSDCDLGEYLRRAGTAMGVAQKAGGDRYQRWEPGLIADR